ncbi:GTPase HflX [Clostridiales Family XIII bacterium BX16]|uniref:GTPase HflX n=1 Tax=Lentihominibacter faecis TaxID=2764712 RepID=A0A923SKY3_9FIRM|nr:GTPase HflX [Lentihominibacter faecis]MBC5998704.1 GTPase HflX [Lentihominibacter faecis]
MVRFNENNEVIRNEEYTAILAGIQLREDISYSMEELAGLAEADGVTVAGQMIQSLERPNTATLIGKGKVEELAELCRNMEADMVIFNDELSGVQLRNLEEALEVRVIDRTILILDIFADRAVSREGKLQVELAQLQYRMPRLTGFGRSLSRLGGGIGTRGPGEKKLETDRRHIAGRIDDIKAELARIGKTRQVQRSGREKSQIPVVALMGYTNSGKSAIMNRLLQLSEREDKTVSSQNMLFATLDTQHRKITLEQGSEFILIDTVGFVSRLPHSLVEAFKSTLEEVRYADLLIHVVDSSYENRDFYMEVTNKVIEQIGAGDKDQIVAYNKMDIAKSVPLDVSGHEAVYLSAKTGENVHVLVEKIREKIFGGRVEMTLLIPYQRGDITSYLCENAQIFSMEYEEEGTLLHGKLEREDALRYGSFAVDPGEKSEE